MIVTWRHQVDPSSSSCHATFDPLFGHVMTSSATHQFWSRDRLEKHHFGIELISGNFAKFDFRKKISFWIILTNPESVPIIEKSTSSTLTWPKVISTISSRYFHSEMSFIGIFVKNYQKYQNFSNECQYNSKRCMRVEVSVKIDFERYGPSYGPYHMAKF